MALAVVDAVRGSTMLRSSSGEEAERARQRRRSRILDPMAQRMAMRELAILDAAESVEDLRIPPGNRLEKLSGDRAGQRSIRLNQQWRICFGWTPAGPVDVEIADYR